MERKENHQQNTAIDTILKDYGFDESLKESLSKDIPALVKRYQETDDNEAWTQIRDYSARFVAAIAKQYVGKGMTLDELIETGFAGLKEAAQRYGEDGSSKFKFIPYAAYWIRESINGSVNNKNR